MAPRTSDFHALYIDNFVCSTSLQRIDARAANGNYGKAKTEAGREEGLGMLDGVLQALAKHSPGQVRATFENVRLMPGESTRVKTEFSLPSELEAGRHYVGHFSVYSAEFAVDVFVRE